MAERVYLLLGSNEGDREWALQSAINVLTTYAAAGPVITSATYETAAWGIEEQPAFLNIAIGFDTELSPHELLLVIRDIEHAHGRQRAVVWGQRTLDIDILFFGQQTIQTQELTIPHPHIQDRRFALAPLAEIAPGLMHPVLSKSVDELLASCPDSLPVAVKA